VTSHRDNVLSQQAYQVSPYHLLYRRTSHGWNICGSMHRRETKTLARKLNATGFSRILIPISLLYSNDKLPLLYTIFV
jgi:hypothetical protein